MTVILFFVSIILTTYTMYRRTKHVNTAFIWASLLMGVGITVSAEALSLFQLFKLEWIALFWIIFCLFLIISQKLWRDVPALPSVSFHWMMLPIIGLLVITFVNALASPPNTYDSLTYHMARVTYWEQYGSIAHYPTSEPRQLYQHPFAEYTIAHLQILSDGDRLANFPQWFAFLGSMVAIMLVSQQLGADRRQQWLAVALGATIPMAVVQATSTQNDMVTTYWVLCSTYFIFELRQKITLQNLIGLGISVGLALLTKGTAYVYLAPLLGWITLTLFLRERFGAIYKLAIAGIISVAFIAPHLLRNQTEFGSLTGPDSARYINEVISPAQLTSNILRNIGLNYVATIDNPTTVRISKAVNEGIVLIHDVLNIPVNDPRTTWLGALEFPIIRDIPVANDDKIPAPLHVTFVFLMGIGLIISRKWSPLAQYTLVCLAMLILFALILKWQPWHTRLQMPMLYLFMPSIAMIFNKRLLIVLMIPIFLWAYIWALDTPLRPIWGEYSTLTAPRNQIYRMSDAYLTLAQVALDQNCPIGFHLLSNSVEYLFHVALKQESPTQQLVQIGHVFVKGAEDYNPCVIIANKPLPEDVADQWDILLQTPSDDPYSNYTFWIKK